MEQHRALIMASSRILREGLKLGLKRSSFIVVGEGKNPLEICQQISYAIDAQVIIVLGITPVSIYAVFAQIAEVRLQFANIKCVLVVDSLPLQDIMQAWQTGVDAILPIDATFSAIVNSLNIVMTGLRVFPALPAQYIAPLAKIIETGQVIPSISKDTQLDQPPQSKASALPSQPDAIVSKMIDMDNVPTSALVSASIAIERPDLELLLSAREKQILDRLCDGQPNKVIARALGIAETTVKVHVKSVIRKIEVSNRTQAAVWAINQRSRQIKEPIIARPNGHTHSSLLLKS